MRKLTSFCSIVDSSPTFVLPVFMVPGTNAACVQDLDGKGKIKRFVPIDTSRFHVVPNLPDNIYKTLGDDGILAFWLTGLDVMVGTTGELASMLSNLDESELAPFAAVEAMTLVGDRTRLIAAGERAAKLFSSMRGQRSYGARLVRRVKVLEELRSESSTNFADSDSAVFAAILSQLQAPASQREWLDLWRDAWTRFSKEEVLFSVARWRIENFDMSEVDHVIVSTLVGYPYLKERNEFVLQWLRENGSERRTWYNAWGPLFYQNFERSELSYLGVNLLESDINKKRPISYQWMNAWSRIWRGGEIKRSKLEQIARSALDCNPYRDYFAELVAIPLAREINSEWARSYVRDWLKIPRSLVVWVDTLISFWDSLDVKDRSTAGIAWLERYGRGMNSWYTLWRHMRKHVSDKQFAELGEKWLIDARKELSTWPKVFSETHAARGYVSDSLVQAAKMWVSLRRPNRRNKLIEQIASGQKTLLL